MARGPRLMSGATTVFGRGSVEVLFCFGHSLTVSGFYVFPNLYSVVCSLFFFPFMFCVHCGGQPPFPPGPGPNNPTHAFSVAGGPCSRCGYPPPLPGAPPNPCLLGPHDLHLAQTAPPGVRPAVLPDRLSKRVSKIAF